MPTLNYSRVTGAGAGWTRVETPDGRSFTVKGDRAMRNNNPGNIEYGKFARSMGAIGTDGRFAVFPTREVGIRAQSGLLFGKNYKDLTLADAISKYAPEFENNTAAYAATVAAMSGVSLDTKMADIPADKRTAVVEAMHYVEGNTKARAYDAEDGTLAYTLDGKKSQLPDAMDVPRSLAQATAIEQAYADNFRALDVVPNRALAMDLPARPSTPTPMGALNAFAPPSRFAPVSVGKVTRAPLDAIPASLTPAPVGKVTRAALGPVGPSLAPRGAVYAGITALDKSLPSPANTALASQAINKAPAKSLAHPVSAPKPSNLVAAPIGPVTKGPALAPATSYTPTVVGMPSIPAPTGLPAAPKVAQPLQHPISVPTPPVAPPTPPALTVPPAQVLAPLLNPPKVVKDYPVAEAVQAPTPPRATAYDVYSGLADTALDNTGQNTVSAMPGGGTSVTNKYGVTTGMTPGGYQTAVGSLPGISGPIGSKIGSAVKGAIPGVAGSAIGGLFGGPLGALLGAAIAKAATQPGGLLSGMNSFNTNAFGTINAAKPQSGGAFPGAPTGAWADKARAASLSGGGLDRGLSPKAASDIDAGRGGLF